MGDSKVARNPVDDDRQDQRMNRSNQESEQTSVNLMRIEEARKQMKEQSADL